MAELSSAGKSSEAKSRQRNGGFSERSWQAKLYRCGFTLRRCARPGISAVHWYRYRH